MMNELSVVCYAIAGLIGIIGAMEVYIHMNDDDTHKVKRTIIKVLIAAAILVVTAQILML